MDFSELLDIQAILSGIVLAICGCIVKYYSNKIAKYRNELEEKEEARIRASKKQISDIEKAVSNINQRIDMIAQAGVLLYRERILQTCKHEIKKGYTDFMTRENITAMYEMYHNLGGNGLVTKYYDEYMSIPVSESLKEH